MTPEHTCNERSRLERLEARLGEGDVTLAVMHKTQLEILDQVKLTNGRVSKLERFRQAASWMVIGIALFAVSQRFGLLDVIARAL